LGPSKLRKFIDFYTEFYPKAKTNRKLMMSLKLAEERLRQNDQEISIFEEIRDSLKNKKGRADNQSSRNSIMRDEEDSSF
jgi:hypothetical protein